MGADPNEAIGTKPHSVALSTKEIAHVRHPFRQGEKSMNPGIVAAIGAYVSWGMLPIYWKLLGHVDRKSVV